MKEKNHIPITANSHKRKWLQVHMFIKTLQPVKTMPEKSLNPAKMQLLLTFVLFCLVRC